ncbi:MAG: hypothetical protein WDW36_004933 [Sanguina aurantia]
MQHPESRFVPGLSAPASSECFVLPRATSDAMACSQSLRQAVTAVASPSVEHGQGVSALFQHQPGPVTSRSEWEAQGLELQTSAHSASTLGMEPPSPHSRSSTTSTSSNPLTGPDSVSISVSSSSSGGSSSVSSSSSSSGSCSSSGSSPLHAPPLLPGTAGHPLRCTADTAGSGTRSAGVPTARPPTITSSSSGPLLTAAQVDSYGVTHYVPSVPGATAPAPTPTRPLPPGPFPSGREPTAPFSRIKPSLVHPAPTSAPLHPAQALPQPDAPALSSHRQASATTTNRTTSAPTVLSTPSVSRPLAGIQRASSAALTPPTVFSTPSISQLAGIQRASSAAPTPPTVFSTPSVSQLAGMQRASSAAPIACVPTNPSSRPAPASPPARRSASASAAASGAAPTAPTTCALAPRHRTSTPPAAARPTTLSDLPPALLLEVASHADAMHDSVSLMCCCRPCHTALSTPQLRACLLWEGDLATALVFSVLLDWTDALSVLLATHPSTLPTQGFLALFNAVIADRPRAVTLLLDAGAALQPPPTRQQLEHYTARFALHERGPENVVALAMQCRSHDAFVQLMLLRGSPAATRELLLRPGVVSDELVTHLVDLLVRQRNPVPMVELLRARPCLDLVRVIPFAAMAGHAEVFGLLLQHVRGYSQRGLAVSWQQRYEYVLAMYMAEDIAHMLGLGRIHAMLAGQVDV